MKRDATCDIVRPPHPLTSMPQPMVYPELERILQRRVLYYSDFDIDVNDWKTEQQTLQIFTKTILSSLSNSFSLFSPTCIMKTKPSTPLTGESWTGMLNTVVFRQKTAAAAGTEKLIPEKSAWEVSVEYSLLTLFSEKPAETRVDELASYFSFYGFTIIDTGCFQSMMRVLLAECKKAEHVIQNMWELEKKYAIAKHEAAFNHIKEMHKGYSFDLLPSKKRRRTYTILNRAVTPLIMANEKLVESMLSPSPAESGPQLLPQDLPLEAQMAKMSIQDLLSPDLMLQRKPSKSVNVKRSYLEMHRLRSAPNDIFSVASLKAIFSYVDYESLRFPAPHFIVIGHFAAVVFEVFTLCFLFF